MIRVTHLLGSAGIGGLERQLLLYLKGMDGNRISSDLILFRGGALEESFRQALPTITLHKKRKVDLGFFGRLVSELRASRPDVVHSWGPTPNVWGPFAARLARVPHLIVSEGELDLWKGWGRSRLDRLVGRWSDAVVGNAQAVVDAISARGVRRDRLRVVYNAIEPAPPLSREQREPGLIVQLGRFDPRKGHDIVVRALPQIVRKVPEAHVIFAGAPSLPNEIENHASLVALIDELSMTSRIEFSGAYEDPGPLLRRASVAVTASRSEGLPNTLLEAMMHGAPVVATDVAGNPEAVENGVTGLLIPPDSPPALAEAVVETLTNAGAATERAQRARREVESRFSIENQGREWTDLYVQAVKGRLRS